MMPKHFEILKVTTVDSKYEIRPQKMPRIQILSSIKK